MFKLTNSQLIEMAAVDAGLDPFAEYCTKGVYAAAGYKVRAGERPVLILDLWCPRIKKDSVGSESQEHETSESFFFQFKTCHLFSRNQVISAEELEAEKANKKFAQERKKQLKQAIMPTGIAPSRDYESIPQWCKRKAGVALDVAVERVRAAGFPVDDANELYGLLQAM